MFFKCRFELTEQSQVNKADGQILGCRQKIITETNTEAKPTSFSPPI